MINLDEKMAVIKAARELMKHIYGWEHHYLLVDLRAALAAPVESKEKP